MKPIVAATRRRRTLNDPNMHNDSPGYQLLGDAITQWAKDDSRLERQPDLSPRPEMRHAGLELEI